MKQGLYGGGTVGFIPTPIGSLGGGLYFDSHGNLYPQLYYGTPKASFSGGYTPDLEGLLTGLSVSGTVDRGIRPNLTTSGAPIGIGVGTPGVGVTYGFGPYNVRDIGESFRPRTDEFGQPFPGSEPTNLPPRNNSGSQGATPASGNPVLKFFDSFRPTTDEFGNPFPGPQSSGGVLKYGLGDAQPAAQELSALFHDVSADPEAETSPDIRRLSSRAYFA